MHADKIATLGGTSGRATGVELAFFVLELLGREDAQFHQDCEFLDAVGRDVRRGRRVLGLGGTAPRGAVPVSQPICGSGHGDDAEK